MDLSHRAFALFLTALLAGSAQARPQALPPQASPPGIPGFSLFTVTPCRILDTRLDNTPLLSGLTRVFAVAVGPCGIPSTAVAVSVNLTVVAPTGAGYVTAFPGDGSLPLATAQNAVVTQALCALDVTGTYVILAGDQAGPATGNYTLNLQPN